MTFSISKTALPLCALAAGVMFSGRADAAGFQLTDFSMTGLGRSYAGAGVVGDDYSAIAANPAGMTLKGTGGQAGAAVIWQHGEVKGSADKNNGAPYYQNSRVSGKDDVDTEELKEEIIEGAREQIKEFVIPTDDDEEEDL